MAGCARGACGDLGVSFVASALPMSGVCRMVSESGSRVSAVRFCLESFMGECCCIGLCVVGWVEEMLLCMCCMLYLCVYIILFKI